MKRNPPWLPARNYILNSSPPTKLYQHLRDIVKIQYWNPYFKTWELKKKKNKPPELIWAANDKTWRPPSMARRNNVNFSWGDLFFWRKYFSSVHSKRFIDIEFCSKFCVSTLKCFESSDSSPILNKLKTSPLFILTY